MKTIRRHLQLLPWGENLLTPSASFWLISMRILIFVMSCAEAVSWSYLGYLLGGNGVTRWIGAAFAGITILLVVWIIDSSLATLDVARSEHAAAILGEAKESKRATLARNGFKFIVRGALLFCSLSVTAPFLTQLVFYRDITHFISIQSNKTIATARTNIEAKYDSELERKTATIAAKRREYEAETAGKGLSGRYGDGPAAQALLRDVAQLEAERVALGKEKADKIRQFNLISADWNSNRDRLASEYNVSLPGASLIENSRALAALRVSMENTQIELAIKVFLGLIFGAILLLKLFEPSSVRMYMSEILQQEFLRYKAGVFDDDLGPEEKSTNPHSQMSPQRFYSFLVDTWLKRPEEQIKRDEQRRQERSEIARAEALKQKRLTEARDAAQRVIDDRLQETRRRINTSLKVAQQLRTQRSRLAEEAKALANLREAQLGLVDRINCSQNELAATISEVEQDIRYFEGQVRTYESQKKNSDLPGVGDLVREQKRVRQMRSDANDSLVALRNSAFAERQKARRAQEELDATRKQFNRTVELVDQLNGKIFQLEEQIMSEMLEAGLHVHEPTGGDPVAISDQPSYTSI